LNAGLVSLVLFAGSAAQTPDAGRTKLPTMVRPLEKTQDQMQKEALARYAELEKTMPVFDAGMPNPPFRWKISNIIQEMPVVGTQVVNDVPVKLHSLLVKGSREDVMIEILDHFRASGLYVEDPSKQAQPMRQLQITGLDQERAISYTAMVDAMPDKTCMVVLGEANIGMASFTQLTRKARNEQVKDFAPLMPDAIAPMRTDTEQLHTMTFSVAADEATIRKFYKEKLAQRGYREVAVGTYVKDDEQITMTLRPRAGKYDVLLSLGLSLQAP